MITEKVISHFSNHGKVYLDQLVTVGDLLEFKDQLLSDIKPILDTTDQDKFGNLISEEGTGYRLL